LRSVVVGRFVPTPHSAAGTTTFSYVASAKARRDCPSGLCLSHGCTCTHQQIEEDVVAQEERTYRLGSQHPECQHGHSVTFAAADFAAILQGDSVTNESTTTGQVGEMPTPHHHDVTLTCSPDADNDDVADDVELSMGTDPNDADSDDDGAPRRGGQRRGRHRRGWPHQRARSGQR
jgi:hypothetical protein